MEDRILRTLSIKAFHVQAAREEKCFSLEKESNNQYTLCFDSSVPEKLAEKEPLIHSASLKLISKEERHVPIHSIMDIIPISTKVLGKIGEGITHTLTGIYLVLCGTDTEGNYISAFGNSDGFLDEQIVFDRAGTPGKEDLILLMDICLEARAGYSRSGPDACHRLCDSFCQEIRQVLKKMDGRHCTERHDYQDIERPGKEKVVLVKMVSGQGAMYDTHFLSPEPSGFNGSRSIIESTGSPVILSPNEYRDGAIRALY